MVQGKVEICGVNTAKLPILKEEEKEELFKRIKAGDMEARERYIQGNLRLVLSVIKRFANSNECPDDLFQIGCIGLIKAIDNFKPELNCQFSTYAVPMVAGELRRYLRDNSNSIRVSRSLRDIAYKAIYAKEDYMKKYSKEPTIEEISKMIEIPAEEVILALDAIQKQLLREVADLHDVPEGAYNIRADGKSVSRATTANIDIVTKTDKNGIDIIIAPGTKKESVHIPVLLSEAGIRETVYNDFFIGDDCDVTIMAGCGIHNSGSGESEHSGIHTFYLAPRAKVRYVEKHYGQGEGTGKNVMNPTTVVEMEEDSYLEMETAQIKGVDSTVRNTTARLASGATLVVREKIMTHGTQFAETEFTVDLNGEGCGAHVVSRSVAKDQSRQSFRSMVRGNSACTGHTECDAIIMDDAQVTAIPQIEANHTEASLIHEAAIGKIAGEQLIKLMTLGLSEKEAEEEIINGFLK